MADLDVLMLDCQATSSSPGKGDLLEIGWLRTKAADRSFSPGENNPDSACYLIKLPKGAGISRQIERITGIAEADLRDAIPVKKAWKKLLRAAKKIAANYDNNLCPTVIHFARFEEPYLRRMQREFSPRTPFPFDIICTHRIMRILMPELPRKGLRAAAGYFGHSTPQSRRCASHLEATAFIWGKAVHLLAERLGIYTLPELRDWLDKNIEQTRIKPGAAARVFPMEPQLRKGVPDRPGVYRMLRSNGDLLYVGKAKSLKQRVNSYFRKSAAHGERTLEMLTQAQNLEFTVTGSALEAALLESDEIKKHLPPYNVALRKGARQIAFLSHDLQRVSPQADEQHTRGPLPANTSLAAFAAVAHLLQGLPAALGEATPALILGIPEEYAPEPHCFLQGIELFKQRHNLYLQNGKSHFIAGLMRLGKELHRQMLEELALAKSAAENADALEETIETAALEEEQERVWTPEAAARVIENIIRFAALLLRRSRWFCLLSESSLSWREAIGKEKRRTWLIFEKGAIGARGDLGIEEDFVLAAPPGCCASFRQRQRNFDLTVYDRMRVATTELRRMIAEDIHGDMRLRLSPKVVLAKEELAKLLPWV